MAQKTFGNLKTRILVLLNTALDGTFSDATVTEAAYSAIRQVVEYFPKLSSSALTVFAEDASGLFASDLPADVIDVDAVLDLGTSLFMPRANFNYGDYHGTAVQVNDWSLYSAGKITFSQDPTTNGVTLFYRAYYDAPLNEAAELDTPNLLFNMLSYYAAYEASFTKAETAANIRQYNIKVDSGNPDHNPMLNIGRNWLNAYHNSAKLLPDLQKPTLVQ